MTRSRISTFVAASILVASCSQQSDTPTDLARQSETTETPETSV